MGKHAATPNPTDNDRVLIIGGRLTPAGKFELDRIIHDEVEL